MTKRKHDFEDLASSFGLDAEKGLLESTAVDKIVESTLETITNIPAFDAVEERPGSFDYEQLTLEGRKFLLERQRRIVRIIGTAVIKTGSELRMAKDL